MKKMILLATMLLVAVFVAGAQTTKVSDNTSVNGKTYVSTTTKSGGSLDIKTDYQWSNTRDNVPYDIYLHKYTKGDKAGTWTAYVKRISKKTGKEYNYYLPDGPAIAKDILQRNPNLAK